MKDIITYRFIPVVDIFLLPLSSAVIITGMFFIEKPGGGNLFDLYMTSIVMLNINSK